LLISTAELGSIAVLMSGGSRLEPGNCALREVVSEAFWCQERCSFIDFQKDASRSSQNRGTDNISPSFRARQLRRPRNRRIVASLFPYDAARKAPSYMLGIVDLSVPHAGYSRGNYYKCRPEEHS